MGFPPPDLRRERNFEVEGWISVFVVVVVEFLLLFSTDDEEEEEEEENSPISNLSTSPIVIYPGEVCVTGQYTTPLNSKFSGNFFEYSSSIPIPFCSNTIVVRPRDTAGAIVSEIWASGMALHATKR